MFASMNRESSIHTCNLYKSDKRLSRFNNIQSVIGIVDGFESINLSTSLFVFSNEIPKEIQNWYIRPEISVTFFRLKF